MNKESSGCKIRVPQVKMTKTARLRLLKANPILRYQVEKTNNVEIAKNFNLDTVSLMNKSIMTESEPTKFTSFEMFAKGIDKKELKKGHQFSKLKNDNPELKYKKQQQPISSVRPQKKPLRRSVSAPGLKRKDIMMTIVEDSEEINHSVSIENVSTIPVSDAVATHNEQSIFLHPSTHRKSSSQTSSSTPLDLKRRLRDWLEKKQKRMSAFKHLKCFGVHKIHIVEEENKENYETSCIKKSDSYNDLKIDNPLFNDEDINETTLALAPSHLEKLAEEALKDLNCLISEGYPIEQCEGWLKLIKNKYPQIIERPMYWECRASIEQLRGDIGSAVECYKTAVVHGAEVNSVEQSLDHLLQKFNLLNIDSSADQKKSSKDRKKVVQDFKNVFTSMIIKFAIQEKTIKHSKKNKPTDSNDTLNFSTNIQVVTPVRRSTRLSRSLYTSTPGTKICSSLHELSHDEKQKIIFKPNTALCD